MFGNDRIWDTGILGKEACRQFLKILLTKLEIIEFEINIFQKCCRLNGDLENGINGHLAARYQYLQENMKWAFGNTNSRNLNTFETYFYFQLRELEHLHFIFSFY